MVSFRSDCNQPETDVLIDASCSLARGGNINAFYVSLYVLKTVITSIEFYEISVSGLSYAGRCIICIVSLKLLHLSSFNP